MFNELTKDLLDLRADVKGDVTKLFAMVIDCCSCSCCGCLFLCG